MRAGRGDVDRRCHVIAARSAQRGQAASHAGGSGCLRPALRVAAVRHRGEKLTDLAA